MLLRNLPAARYLDQEGAGSHIRKKILRPDAAYASETSRRPGRNPARYVFSGQTMHFSAHAAPNATRPCICVLDRSGLRIGLPDD